MPSLKQTLKRLIPHLLIGALFLQPAAQAAPPSPEDQNREVQIQKKKEAIEIKARERLAAAEALGKPVEKIQERKLSVPEVPQALRERELGPAETVQLQTLEQAYANGQITEMEYQMKKDTLERRSNVQF